MTCRELYLSAGLRNYGARTDRAIREIEGARIYAVPFGFVLIQDNLLRIE